MPRAKNDSLTPLELEIMEVLWRLGPSTVQSVQEALAAQRPLAYTSVQTMLNVLERKGKANRTRGERAHVYAAKVTRDRTVTRVLDDVINRLFGGSADSLVMNLIESRSIDAAKLEELEALVRRKRKERK